MDPDEWERESLSADGGHNVETVRRRAIESVRACLAEIGRLAFDRRSLNDGPVPGDLDPTALVETDEA